jgi:hypothetical protein
MTFGGKELYPSSVDKAAVVAYSISGIILS